MNHKESRIYGNKTDLDYAKIKSFFEKRKEKIGYLQPLNLTMYQDKNPELAFLRDNFEKNRFFELINLPNKIKILDIGCGVGRWGFHLSEFAEIYLGFDYSEYFIKIAQSQAIERNFANLNFQVLSATDFKIQDLFVQPPFDLTIIAGVMAYLNDKDCVELLKKVDILLSNNGTFYLREPIGIENRLTLTEFYSEEMEMEYSAVYRTIDEYLALFDESKLLQNMKTIKNEALFPSELNNRKETAQHIFVFEKVSK